MELNDDLDGIFEQARVGETVWLDYRPYTVSFFQALWIYFRFKFLTFLASFGFTPGVTVYGYNSPQVNGYYEIIGFTDDTSNVTNER